MSEKKVEMETEVIEKTKQALAIEEGFRQEHKYFYVQGRLCRRKGDFKHCADVDTFIDAIITDLKKHDNKHLTTEYYAWALDDRRTLYLDLECKQMSDEDVRAFYNNLDPFLIKLDEQIAETYPGLTGNRKVTIYALEDAIQKHKVSLHVMYPNIDFEDGATAKEFIKTLEMDDVPEGARGPKNNPTKMLDTSVYKRNQYMRFPFCLKDWKDEGKEAESPILYPYPPTEDEEEIREIFRVCTLCPPEVLANGPRKPIQQNKSKSKRQRTSIANAVVQPVDDTMETEDMEAEDIDRTPEELIWPESLVSNTIAIIKYYLRIKFKDRTSDVKHNKENLYTISNNDPQTPCAFGERHDSNNQYVFLEMNRLVFRCHGGKCEKKEKSVCFKYHSLVKEVLAPYNQDFKISSETLEQIGNFFKSKFRAANPKERPTIANQWRFAYMRYINRFFKKISVGRVFVVVVLLERNEYGAILQNFKISPENEFRKDFKSTYLMLPIEKKDKDGKFKTIIEHKFSLVEFYLGRHTYYLEDYKDERNGFQFYPCTPDRDNRRQKVKTKKFNTFTGFDITQPIAEKWQRENTEKCMKDIETWKKHIFVHICNEQTNESDFFNKLIATNIQTPEKKLQVVVVVRGGQGNGKSLVGQMLKKIYGQSAHSISDIQKLTRKFNVAFENKVFIVGEEALFHGAAAENSKLKSLITDPILDIEPKGKESYTVDKYQLYIFLTNHEFVLPVGLGERRYFVIVTSDYWEGKDNSKEKKAYFKSILDIDPRSIAFFYYTMDLKGFEPYEVPRTQGLRQQQEYTTQKLAPVYAFWKDVFNGYPGICEEEKTVTTTGKDQIDRDHNIKPIARPIIRVDEQGNESPATTLTPIMILNNFFTPWSKSKDKSYDPIHDSDVFMKKTYEIFNPKGRKKLIETVRPHQPRGFARTRFLCFTGKISEYKEYLEAWFIKRGGVARKRKATTEVEEAVSNKKQKEE